jgi:membrane-associated phospholipid phosphatase
MKREIPAARLGLRSSEWLLLVYFSYAAAVTLVLGLRPGRVALAVALPVGIGLLPLVSRIRPKVIEIARDWLALALVPAAYWQADWFRFPGADATNVPAWAAWDPIILDQWRLRAAIDQCGWILQSLLEFSYTLVYAIPPLAVSLLYLYRRRDRVDQFLFTFLLGTLLSYALLPYFPSESPRLLFPGLDEPQMTTIWRRFNIWVLAHYDIHSSVFPSGHVSAAFSAAFALLVTLPERKWPARFLLTLAASVGVTTVYGRYHWAADSLAGLAVSLTAVGISAPLRRALFGTSSAAPQPARRTLDGSTRVA